MNPRLLDLFCGAGGAAMGYHRAGFEVTGVDIVPQPRFPFDFIEADALAFLAGWKEIDLADEFDAIHASPPCQAYSSLRTRWKRDYPDLLAEVRTLLEATGLPWVIENVPGSPVRAQIMLCGSSFGLGIPGHYLQRHRYFETSFALRSLVPGCAHGRVAIGAYGRGRWDNSQSKKRGGVQGSRLEKREALGIDWMSDRELSQAIPPAYTEWVGAQLLDELRAVVS